MIMGGGAAGAWITPKLVELGYDCRVALALMGVPTLFAMVAAMAVLTNTCCVQPDPTLTGRLLRRPRTWALMVAFGLVNGGYASLVAWLAPFYQSMGWTATANGSLVAAMAIAQAFAALAVPFLARRSLDRRPWLFATLLMQGVGFAGLAFLPMAAPFVWAVVCGAGLAASFALAIVTALDHLPVADQVGTLAALMQGGGFLIAAFAPYEMALLIEGSGGFVDGWVMHLIFVAMTAALYLQFDPKRYAEVMNSAAPGTQSNFHR